MYYSQQHNKISAAWTIDTEKIGGKKPEAFRIVKGTNGEALSIAPIAVTKALTEVNILRAMTTATEELGKITDEVAWKKIAQLHPTDAELDNRSISLIKGQNPTITEDDLTHLTRKFQELIALDTVRNEYRCTRSCTSGWSTIRFRDDVEKLNEKVYETLFLTPGSDPWLGLFSPEVYTALDNGGLIRK
jgi:hypothetical protein